MVIIIVALMVIRPERLPEIAYLLGHCLGKLRFWYFNLSQKCKDQILKE
jgi:Sec-independent protein translocase protein TatA